MHVASWDKWLAAGDAVGALLSGKRVAAQGDRRRWDGVPKGVAVAVTF